MYKNLNDLKLGIQDVMAFDDTSITLFKADKIHENVIDSLVFPAVFSPDETMRTKCRRVILQIAAELGIYSASIRPLYKAYGEGAVKGFTVPAMNIRTLTYDLCRTIFRVAEKQNAAAFLIEIARSESEYTEQAPEEFIVSVMAAAIKEQYRGPVFIQGDHCQFSQKKYAADKQAEIQNIKDWVGRLIDAGFRNIDIDGSTLVDLSLPSLHAQQKENAHVTAILTDFIRTHQPEGSDIAIGGEIGHIGDKNSTPEDFEAFMSQYLYRIPRNSGVSKVSVQTGTSHGGVVGEDGKVQAMAVDMNVLKTIGTVARQKYFLAGPVQHGASTLPEASFHTFVEAGTVEIHLSTGFQNIVYDNMPADLREEMYRWDDANAAKDRAAEWNEAQFQYKTRKKALGPFKERLWSLPKDEKQPIIQALEKYVTTIFDQLHIANTRDAVDKYIPKPIK